MKNIQLISKRWRDKVNGNSYFSAKLYGDGEFLVALPFQYGYGSQPEWEAAAQLRRMGLLPEGCYGLSEALRQAGLKYNYLDIPAKRWLELSHVTLHNLGVCAEEDVLLAWPLTGHYRYPKR